MAQETPNCGDTATVPVPSGPRAEKLVVKRHPCMFSRICPLLCLLVLLGQVLSAETSYEIDLADAKSGWLAITAETTCPRSQCDFQLPVWNAVYQVRDFAQHVVGFEVQTSRGSVVPTSKRNPSLWRLSATPGDRVEVRYRVRADRPGPFGAVAGSEHVCLNLAQVLAYPVDARRHRFTLRLRNVPPRWKVGVELPTSDGAYNAPSYDRLVDTPFHLSDSDEAEFNHAGRRIRILAHPRGGDYNLRALKQMAGKVVATATELMGDVPFPSYTFVYHFSDAPGGGMEYRNGTSIYGPRQCGECDMSGLTAHEFFHVWNIKRIRPQSLEPVEFTQPNYSPSLWFSEGVTSAYSEYIRLQSGLRSRADFLARLGRLITDHERRPASRTQSAEESSIEAWLERHPAYGRPDRSTSYYLKGEIVAHLLDLSIRHWTGNRRSLDDVMRQLNREYAQKGRYFNDTEALESIAGEVAARDLSGVFDELIRTAGKIPWNRYLGYAGYKLSETKESRLDLGMSLSNPPGLGIVVTEVDPTGPAATAGLQLGDRLVTIGGKRPTGGPGEVTRQITIHQQDGVQLGVERAGVPFVLSIKPRKIRQSVYRFAELKSPTRLQLAVRQGWLERRTAPSSKTVSSP